MVSLVFFKIFASFGIAANIYYLFISRRFAREHKAVLSGKIKYWHSVKNPMQSSALLRRNTHRLEKGLIMRPRRPVFAEDYIVETVQCFAKAFEQDSLCNDEEKWIADVLSEYFDAVEDTPVVSRARSIFMSLVPLGKQNITSTPYPHSNLPSPPISFDQLKQLFIRRRAVRWFENRPVPMIEIEKAVSAAALAPSACNRQPFRFFATNEAEKSEKIAKCAMGTQGFAENIPCIMAVVGSLDAFPHERDRHLIYIDGSLASMQLMLAFETLGLSTCPINWPDIESRERMIEQLLGVESHERTIMLIAVGYADPTGGIPYSQKKDSSILLKVI